MRRFYYIPVNLNDSYDKICLARKLALKDFADSKRPIVIVDRVKKCPEHLKAKN